MRGSRVWTSDSTYPAQRWLAAIGALALAFASNPACAAGAETNEYIPVAPSQDSPAIAKARELVRQRMDAIAQQEAAGTNSTAPARAKVSPSSPPPAPAAPAIVPAAFSPLPAASTPPATNPAPAAPEPTPTAPQTPVNPAPAAPPPAPAPPAAPLPRPAPPPPSPAAESTVGKTLYSFQAADLELRAALASFAKANNLNIVPDNDVTGTVTLDVRDLPLDLMMRALLEASDCAWHQEAGLIRVRNTETRTFSVDYLRLSRKGVGQSSATIASGTSSGGVGGVGGGGGGASSGGGGTSGGGSGGSGTASSGNSAINLTADNPIDFWKELKEEMGFMLTEKGKSSIAVNMTAGLLQVTDRPSALKKVESYLSGVEKHVHRQVDLEATIYDVTLGDQFQFGIDWVHVAEAYGGAMGFGGATLPVAIGGAQLQNSALSGLNHGVGSLIPGGNIATLVFSNFNTAAAITALSEQGKVEIISKPRIRTLNNQTALIKVGEEVPFFNTSTTFLGGTTVGTSQTVQETVVNSITIGTILYLTPQISDNDWISLDISPVLTSLKAVVSIGGAPGPGTAGATATAPDLDTKQASTLVRVHDGTTIVLGGLIQTQAATNLNKIPILGDIPLLGKLFTGTFKFKQKQELVIFVTPHIIREDEPSVEPRLVEEDSKYSWKRPL